MHGFVQYNWRYFYKRSILHSIQDASEDIENQEQFLSIMQVGEHGVPTTGRRARCPNYRVTTFIKFT
jgi:hypothetical protein